MNGTSDYKALMIAVGVAIGYIMFSFFESAKVKPGDPSTPPPAASKCDGSCKAPSGAVAPNIGATK